MAPASHDSDLVRGRKSSRPLYLPWFQMRRICHPIGRQMFIGAIDRDGIPMSHDWQNANMGTLMAYWAHC